MKFKMAFTELTTNNDNLRKSGIGKFADKELLGYSKQHELKGFKDFQMNPGWESDGSVPEPHGFDKMIMGCSSDDAIEKGLEGLMKSR